VTSLLAATLAIVGATVHSGDGPSLENATIVIEGDRIAVVRAGMAPPPGARLIDAGGRVVTPGLIDPATALGLVEIWAVPATRDLDSGPGGPIRAAHRAVDSFNPDSALIPIQRAHGITTVISLPGGGLISGQAGAFDLSGESVVAPAVAMVAQLGGQADGSRGHRVELHREAFDDARRYDANRKDFERNQFRSTSLSRVDLEALVPVVRGELPLAVHVDRSSDLLTVLRLAEEEKIRVVILGAAEGWRVADALAKAEVGVIVDPVVDLPWSFDMIHARADNAALLEEAGVRVMLSTFGAHNVRKLRQWAGNAVRAGMSHAGALRAITATPAEVFGLTDRGTIAPGKVANLVVWSGDPFELSTRVEALVIQGRTVDLAHRQRALFERYRTVPPKIP